MTLSRYRPLALVLLVLHVNACTSWAPTAVSPRQFIEEEQRSGLVTDALLAQGEEEPSGSWLNDQKWYIAAAAIIVAAVIFAVVGDDCSQDGPPAPCYRR